MEKLIWKELILDGEKTNYIISECGDVYNILTKHMLKQFTDNSGRFVVCLTINGKTYTKRVHYLVYIAFYGKLDPSLTINHIDEDFTHNHYTNLEPMTRSMNCITYRKNNGIPIKKYSDVLIEEICNKLSSGIYYKDLAIEYNIPIQFMYQLVKGRRRKFVVNKYLPFPESAYIKNKCREIPHDIIDSLVKQGYSNNDIYDILQLKRNDANRNVLTRTRKKLNIPEPKYFSNQLIEQISSLICANRSNKEIYQLLNLKYNNRIANLIARLRQKFNILNFNPDGIPINIQKDIIIDITKGMSNNEIRNKYQLEKSPYITNMLGRLRQKVKQESSTTIES